VHVRQVDQWAELSVHDDGPGIPAEFRESVFERFRRLDASRTGEAGGSGLGLAIVADLVSAHDGTVSIQPSTTGALVVIRLPVLAY
jgi:signal transduction histidine kinase